MFLFIGAKLYYVAKNRFVHTQVLGRPTYTNSPSSRQRIWDAMSSEEKKTYLEATTDKGNKRYAEFDTDCIMTSF